MYNILLIIVLYFLIHQSFATMRVENITVTQGENVRFHCQFPSDISFNENIIQWKKIRSSEDNILISINGKVSRKYEKTYQTILTDRSSSFDVLHVTKEDSTTYICQTFETQTILCQYNLVVLIKPEAPSLTVNKENIEEYQAVTLTCSSLNGNPPPQYTWYRNSVLVTSLDEQVITTNNNSIYTFNVTRFDNNVLYECQIWNQALTIPLRIEQYLHVKYRPYVNILDEATIFSSEKNLIRKIIGIEQQQFNLTCHYDANPSPTSIYWLTNGTTIVSREKLVYIPRLRSEQSGTYTCVVENSISKVNQSVYLDVQYPPRVRSISSRIRVNCSDSVVLRCLVDSNPSPYKIVWLKNNTEIFRDYQLADLYLTQVERNHSGVYTCVVYNRFHNNQTSNSSHAIELIVQSRPIIETTYSKIAAEIGQSVMLTCRVIGLPKPNIIWKYNEQIIACNEIINDMCFLHFSKIAANDFGTYRCVAENLLGQEEWSYTIVSRGKPETPKHIIVLDTTSSSFKIQFTPSFDGGSGSQEFVIQVTDSTNQSIITQQNIPFNTYEYYVKGLNESTLYKFRMKATNQYGDSLWSNETFVTTSEFIVTPDDLPQLYVVSYNPRDHLLQFDYLPDNSRTPRFTDEQLCLNIRQSLDRKIYQAIPQCLTILNRRVRWKLEKEFSYFKLSTCSKRHQHVCGKEIEMNEEMKARNSTPMLIGIFVMTSFLMLIIVILIVIICARARKHRLKSNVNKFGMITADKGARPIISEPRLQKPYLLYVNANTISSPYNYDYQQTNISKSRSHSSDIIIAEPTKDEIQYGGAARTATIHTSPHWSRSNSRSGSNPSSESSCITQNTNIMYGHNESHPNSNPILVSHYGFPPIISPVQQSSSSSGNSTPNRMKKLFYEVVV
ncbi:unnamed protein product [Rotaria magnacalcarata]|uniref:Uncharacterized protein n=3 Tax=Rotaria magnacalcarata TaxID=392030 RepID=A0A816LWJ7_9BILA|nr:unnamed protein product [Rotaria magnacalcarata]CAF3750641.1 unnamed protein product [Rotaria magnacalcarata]